jgi:hypothetical protein
MMRFKNFSGFAVLSDEGCNQAVRTALFLYWKYIEN